MQISEENLEYLNGSKFSNGLNFPISKKENVPSLRMDFIEKLVYKKSVLHVGCIDHVPLIENKISKNQWLHKRIMKSSKKCLGIDINEEGINFVKNLGYENILNLDLINDDVPEEIHKDLWDYFILGEVLEHIDNPVEFLSAIQTKYKGIVERIVITVPNALKYSNFKKAMQHTEYINSDHRYWFTPYTLAKIVTLSNMLPINNFYFVQGHAFDKNKLFHKLMLNMFPALRDTIIMVANI